MSQGRVRVAFGVVAHPSRRGMVMDLLGRLSSLSSSEPCPEYPQLGTIWRPDVLWDDDGLGSWGNSRRVWLSCAHHAWATHVCVLEDDALPCDGFADAAARAIAALPDSVISFFARKPIIRTALKRRANWVRMGDMHTGVCMAAPVSLVLDWLDWERSHVRPECPYSDQRMSMFLLSHQRSAWFTVPSLVDHRGDESVMTGCPHETTPGRRATVFAGSREWAEGRTLEAVDWRKVAGPYLQNNTLDRFRGWLI